MTCLYLTRIFAFVSILLLTACARQPVWLDAVAGDGPGHSGYIYRGDVVVKDLPKSARGNPASYTVFGETYEVLDTAEAFKEWGEASWYGKKFHGRETSSGEIYDMYQMTAAHKHLPLPTFVRVTRLDNNRSVVVKVNDRGPFVGDRVIDLSYAAAARLGILQGGKIEVFIEALSTHVEPSLQLANASVPERKAPASQQRETTAIAEHAAKATAEQTAEPAVVIVSSDRVDEDPSDRQHYRYAQVGAFRQVSNATRLKQNLQPRLALPVTIDLDLQHGLYRVRVGPLNPADDMVNTLRHLKRQGVDAHPVVMAAPASGGNYRQ